MYCNGHTSLAMYRLTHIPAEMVNGRSFAVIGGKLTVLRRLSEWEEVDLFQRMVYVPSERERLPSGEWEDGEGRGGGGEGLGTTRQRHSVALSPGSSSTGVCVCVCVCVQRQRIGCE